MGCLPNNTKVNHKQKEKNLCKTIKFRSVNELARKSKNRWKILENKIEEIEDLVVEKKEYKIESEKGKVVKKIFRRKWEKPPSSFPQRLQNRI